MFEPSEFAVAVACGTAGAFVDVSEYVLFNEGGVSRSWGAPSPFDDVRPGQFSVTFDNSDGRFTPGATVFATSLVEGMRVCWQLGGRLVEGTIRSFAPSFGDVANADTARMRITCDDELGAASRLILSSLTASMVDGANRGAFWPCDDVAGSPVAASVDTGGLRGTGAVSMTFGGDERPGGDGTQLRLTTDDGRTGELVRDNLNVIAALGSVPGAYVGLWVTASNSTSYLEVSAEVNNGSSSLLFTVPIRFGVQNNSIVLWNTVSASWVVVGTIQENLPTHISAGIDGAGSAGIYVDGVLAGSYSHDFAANSGGPEVSLIVGNASFGATDLTVSEIALTGERLLAEAAFETNIAGRLSGLAQTDSSVTLSALPAGLSDATLGAAQVAGGSLLQALADALYTEQGYVYTETTGTLTNPTTVLKVRERARPQAVDYTFTTTTDILGQPNMDRDLNNTVSTVTVNGPTNSVRVTDDTLTPIVGAANRTETTLLVNPIDLRAWGEDRLIRGTNVGLDVQEFTVDARGTDTDRWADLLAAIPGDRIRIAGLPATQLGAATFDGWLIGARENHSAERNLFTLRLARALPDVAVYDTSRYMADGELTLSAGVNASATSFSIATTGARLSTAETPYTVQFGDEQVTVTACTSATPQVATVTRGVNGTSAVAHSSGAVLVGPVPDSIYAF